MDNFSYICEIMATTKVADSKQEAQIDNSQFELMSVMEKEELIETMEKEMLKAAQDLEFERAANLRDEIERLCERMGKQKQFRYARRKI